MYFGVYWGLGFFGCWGFFLRGGVGGMEFSFGVFGFVFLT